MDMIELLIYEHGLFVIFIRVFLYNASVLVIYSAWSLLLNTFLKPVMICSPPCIRLLP